MIYPSPCHTPAVGVYTNRAIPRVTRKLSQGVPTIWVKNVWVVASNISTVLHPLIFPPRDSAVESVSLYHPTIFQPTEIGTVTVVMGNPVILQGPPLVT